MAQLISVKLARFDGSPWGFRLQGGKDFGTPLIVQKVNGGSPAEQAGLRAGDAVIRVNTTDMFNLRHKDAQDVIVRSGNSFEMTVQRGGSTWRPSVSPVTPSIPSPQPSAPASCISPVTKTSLAAKKQDAPLIGSGHNFTPKPFLNGSSEGPIKSIVNKQYNSPVGIYSEETIAETLSAQAEVLAGGVLGVNFKKNEKNYNAQNSEVFKMVQEADKEPRSPEPAEPASNSGVVTPVPTAIAGLRSVSAPETKPQPTTPQGSLPPGQNICADCERLIVGVFVRIKEKNLHVECFKCSTCGTSLKNVGYYNINNKLYCDIHAKLVARQQAPSGLSPITIPPGGKAPAGTISAALSNLGGGPLSPSLNSLGSPQPFAARSHHRTSGDLDASQRRPCRTEPQSYCPANGHELTSNGSYVYDERDCYTEQDSCNAKTYTSTITIRTGNEVGRLSDRVNELFLDDNRNPTNKLYVSRDDDLTNRDNKTIQSSSSSPPTRLSNGNGDGGDDDESRLIVYEPSIGRKRDDDDRLNGGSNESATRHREQEPAVVNTCGVPRYQVTNQRLKSGTFSSYHPPSNADHTSTVELAILPAKRHDRTSEPRANGREPDNSNSIFGNGAGYQTIAQRRFVPCDSSVTSPFLRVNANSVNDVTDSDRSECLENRSYPPLNGANSEGSNQNSRVASTNYRPVNGRSESSTTDFINRHNPPNSSSGGPKPPTTNEMTDSDKSESLENQSYRQNQQTTVQYRVAPYDFSVASPFYRTNDNAANEVTDSDKSECLQNQTNRLHNGAHSEGLSQNNRVASATYRPINGRSESSISDSTNYPNNPNSLSSGGPKPPTPPPAMSLSTSTSSMSSARPNRLGTPPVDTPSFRPVQSHPTNNISGPKPFGGSSVVAPSSFVAPSVINSGSNTLPRPQSQTVTANDENLNRNDHALKPVCCTCNKEITRGPFITALGQIWCPEHFVCVNSQCRRALQDIGFVEEKGQLHCEYCFERFIAPACNKCNSKIKGDCLNAVGKHFHPECFNCSYCGKLFGNSPFFLEEGLPYCESDWNELFTTKCYACGFPVEAGDRWVEALNNNYHSQCFNCTMCKKNLEGQSFYAKGGRPFCKNHAR